MKTGYQNSRFAHQVPLAFGGVSEGPEKTASITVSLILVIITDNLFYAWHDAG